MPAPILGGLLRDVALMHRGGQGGVTLKRPLDVF